MMAWIGGLPAWSQTAAAPFRATLNLLPQRPVAGYPIRIEMDLAVYPPNSPPRPVRADVTTLTVGPAGQPGQYVALLPSLTPAIYTAAATFPQPGVYLLQLTVQYDGRTSSSAFRVVVDPPPATDSGTFLVANSRSQDLSIVDVGTLREIGRLAVGGPVTDLWCDAERQRVWVAAQTADGPAVIGLRTDNFSPAETVAVPALPTRGTAAPDGLHAVCGDSDLLLSVPLPAGKIATAKTAVGPTCIAAASDGATVLVANENRKDHDGPDTVSWFATNPLHEFGRLPVDPRPAAVAVSPRGGIAAVVCSGGPSLLFLDIRTIRAIARLTLPAPPLDVAFTPDGDRVLALLSGGVLAAYQTRPDYGGGRIELACPATSLAVGRDSLAVVCGERNSVILLRERDLSVAGEVPVGGAPSRACWCPPRHGKTKR